tara:strand:- start:156 stop:776 length:621 start_codon:yes stop_codon:yes gene_type:complete
MGLFDKFKKKSEEERFDDEIEPTDEEDFDVNSASQTPDGLRFIFQIQLDGHALPKEVQTADHFDVFLGKGVFLAQLFDRVSAEFRKPNGLGHANGESESEPDSTILTVRFLGTREPVIHDIGIFVPEGFDDKLKTNSEGQISIIDYFRHKNFTAQFNDMELISESAEYRYDNLATAYQQMVVDILQQNGLQCKVLESTLQVKFDFN